MAKCIILCCALTIVSHLVSCQQGYQPFDRRIEDAAYSKLSEDKGIWKFLMSNGYSVPVETYCRRYPKRCYMGIPIAGMLAMPQGQPQPGAPGPTGPVQPMQEPQRQMTGDGVYAGPPPNTPLMFPGNNVFYRVDTPQEYSDKADCNNNPDGCSQKQYIAEPHSVQNGGQQGAANAAYQPY
ncbi:hypothetical protein HDE_02166 [Halotydeus destructor]|nr:hypothetical protein HDE_02166 [Halotydeus destructor]